SENVRERIERLYHRSAEVIYPPVDYDFYSAPVPSTTSGTNGGDDFYLIVTALAPYKRVELALEAVQKLNRPLVVIGEGQQSRACRQCAGNNVLLLGWLSNEELRRYSGRARSVLFPGEEDFGIVPLEAMAAGCPVIALGKGGALETVVAGETGLFFETPTVP